MKYSYFARSAAIDRTFISCVDIFAYAKWNLHPEMIDPLYVASGFGVGLLVGMTGVGGSTMTALGTR